MLNKIQTRLAPLRRTMLRTSMTQLRGISQIPDADPNTVSITKQNLAKSIPSCPGFLAQFVMARGRQAPQSLLQRTGTQHLAKLLQCSLEALPHFDLAHDVHGDSSLQKFELKLHAINAQPKDNARHYINSPNRNGELLLHELIRKNRGKHLKSLLLHCGSLINYEAVEGSTGRCALEEAHRLDAVEMVAVLCAAGARLPVTPNQLNRAAVATMRPGLWRAALNLDSGRLLNSSALQQMMADLVLQSCPADFHTRMLQTSAPISNAMLRVFGSGFAPYKVSLTDGCDAITSNEPMAATARFSLMHRYLHAEDKMATPLVVVPPSICTVRPVIDVSADLGAVLDRHHVQQHEQWSVAGRTAFFKRQDGCRLAVKFSKQTEVVDDDFDTHPLVNEFTLSQALCAKQQEWGLLSQLPRPAALVQLDSIPVSLRMAIEGQAASGHHGFSLPRESQPCLAYLYEAPEQYERYLSDPSLDEVELRQGMQHFIHDFARTAAHGWYHTAPADFQHDQEGEDGQGRVHLWSFESWLRSFRYGAGRIERWHSGVSAPNARVTGLADLKHIKTLHQCQERYCASRLHTEHPLKYSPLEQQLLIEAELLGSGLFAGAIMLASNWSQRFDGTEDGESLGQLFDLENHLQSLFVDYISGFLQTSPQRSEDIIRHLGVDFPRMAAQMQFFCTSQYADHVTQRQPRHGVLGAMYQYSKSSLSHFAQATDISSSYHAIDPDLMSELFKSDVNRLPSEHIIPEVSTHWAASSPYWDNHKGWVNIDGDKNLGPYEGPLPLQHLISGIYATVYGAKLLASVAPEV